MKYSETYCPNSKHIRVLVGKTDVTLFLRLGRMVTDKLENK